MKKLEIISFWAAVTAFCAAIHAVVLLNCFHGSFPTVSHLVLSTGAHGHAYSFAPDFCLSRAWDLVIIPVVALVFIIAHVKVRRMFSDQTNIEEYKFDLLLRIYLSFIVWTIVIAIADKVLLPRVASWPLDVLFGAWCFTIFIVTMLLVDYFCDNVKYALTAAPAITIGIITSVFLVSGMEYGLITGTFAASWIAVALFLGKTMGGLAAERRKQKDLPGIPLTPKTS